MRIWALVLLAVACSSGAREAAKPPPAPPAARPAPPPKDPATALADDIAWLTAPETKGRGSNSPEARAVADRLEQELRALGFETSRGAIPRTADQTNVAGVLRGADEAILLVAHYDHLGEGFPGADDNASGVAVVLAIARDLAPAHDAKKKTIIVLFTGAEEIGLLGAKAYAAAPVFPLERTACVINFDMVGRNFFELFVGRERTFALVGSDTAPDVTAAVRAAAGEEGMDLVTVTTELIAFLGGDWRSDDWVFHKRGVPAVHVSTGLHQQYHLPEDTADRLKPEQMLRISRTAARAVRSLW